jgi:hypothetical protein
LQGSASQACGVGLGDEPETVTIELLEQGAVVAGKHPVFFKKRVGLAIEWSRIFELSKTVIEYPRMIVGDLTGVKPA